MIVDTPPPIWVIFRFYMVDVEKQYSALIYIVAENIIFLANSRSKFNGCLFMSNLKSTLLIRWLEEQRKVTGNSLKMYLKTPGKLLEKLLEKGMSWSVGTMKL